MNKKLTVDAAQKLISKLPFLKALDLSKNQINSVPRGLPATLIAIDLSYNLFADISGLNKMKSITELKLNNNAIESMIGIATAVSLEYIDLSSNKISVIEGLEMLSSLKHLSIADNCIKYLVNVRLLTMNKSLTYLDLSGNDVTKCPSYRSEVAQLLPQLESLDKEIVTRSRLNRGKSYVGIMPPSNEILQKSISNTSLYLSHLSMMASDIGSIDGSDDEELEECDVDFERSRIPWRNPPQLIPR